MRWGEKLRGETTCWKNSWIFEVDFLFLGNKSYCDIVGNRLRMVSKSIQSYEALDLRLDFSLSSQILQNIKNWLNDTLSGIISITYRRFSSFICTHIETFFPLWLTHLALLTSLTFLELPQSIFYELRNPSFSILLPRHSLINWDNLKKFLIRNSQLSDERAFVVPIGLHYWYLFT